MIANVFSLAFGEKLGETFSADDVNGLWEVFMNEVILDLKVFNIEANFKSDFRGEFGDLFNESEIEESLGFQGILVYFLFYFEVVVEFIDDFLVKFNFFGGDKCFKN